MGASMGSSPSPSLPPTQAEPAPPIDEPEASRWAESTLPGLGSRPDDAAVDALDVDKARARAKLKARLFQIESEPLRIGRFPILGRLGEGGMGTVFSAYDEQLDRKIALKVMLPTRGAGSSQGRERMRREAQAMARLSHPNIVAVHEVGEVGEQVFIAMEFVRGASLDAWLAQRPRGWSEVLEVFRRAGAGLVAAHEAGLVHRDFKPGNVMVGDDGQVKILDFGLARASGQATARTEPEAASAPLEPSTTSLTRTGAIVGTPAFMAPEQHLGQPATAQSDQFAFCVALFAALHGVHPFPTSSLPALVTAICEGAPAEPPKDSPVPAWIRRVVLRGLAREPQARYPSMAALLDALAADPSARRRRWITGGVALAVVLASGLGVARLAEAEPCPDGRAALGSAWDDERRGRVAVAVRDGAPHGPDTWARVGPALDAYAEAWIASSAQACEAHRSGAASDLFYEHRQACLLRSRSALDALAGVLEQADATAVEKAVTAVAGLPALSRCEDAQALLARVQPPAEGIAPEVAALRDDLARARAVEDAGRLSESAATAERVLGRAEPLDYPPLVAEALLRRGTARLLLGQAAEADDDLGRAAFVAIRAGHDDVAGEAAARKIYVRSEQLGRPAEAEVELPWARALVERAGDEGLLGLLLHNAAAVEIRAGDLASARALSRQSLEVRRRRWPSDPEIALTLANLGRIERDLGDYAAAIETMREAVDLTERSLGPRHPQRAMIGTVLGTALLEYGLYADADAELARTDAIYRESLGDQTMHRYYVLYARGELQRRERRWAQARAALEAAVALAEAQVGAHHPMLSDPRLALAEVTLGEGDPATAEAMARAAVEQLEATLGADNPYVATAWLRFGRMLLAGGDLERAQPCLARALELARAQPGSRAADLAWFELWHARARLASEDPAVLTATMEQRVHTLAAAFPDDGPHMLEARTLLADARLASGDPQGALDLLERNEAALARMRAPDDLDLGSLRERLAAVRGANPNGAR